MKLSVILPTYNEAENIAPLVQAILKNLPDSNEYEIIIVDDNSHDGTFRIATELSASNKNIIPVLRTHDRGLAQSIGHGIQMATGDKVLVMDTDFTHDPGEIPKMLHVAQVFDMIVGSRFCQGGEMSDKPHYIASLVYNWLIRLVLRTQIQDNLGGYFVATRADIVSLPANMIFFGYGDYFFRLLHLARKSGMEIVELPSKYRTRHKGSSKSNFFRLFFSYTVALFRFRLSTGWRGTL